MWGCWGSCAGLWENRKHLSLFLGKVVYQVVLWLYLAVRSQIVEIICDHIYMSGHTWIILLFLVRVFMVLKLCKWGSDFGGFGISFENWYSNKKQERPFSKVVRESRKRCSTAPEIRGGLTLKKCSAPINSITGGRTRLNFPQLSALKTHKSTRSSLNRLLSAFRFYPVGWHYFCFKIDHRTSQGGWEGVLGVVSALFSEVLKIAVFL